MTVRSRPLRVLIAAGAAVAVAAGALTASAPAAQAEQRQRDAERPSRASPNQLFLAKSTRMMSVAAGLKGVPYRRGGSTPAGFDCSGFSLYVLAKVGVTGLPRTADAIFRSVPAVSYEQARAGDLVFFRRKGSSRVHHMGVYAGNDRYWHAQQSGTRVRLEYGLPWSKRTITFGRALNAG